MIILPQDLVNDIYDAKPKETFILTIMSQKTACNKTYINTEAINDKNRITTFICSNLSTSKITLIEVTKKILFGRTKT